MDHITAAYNFVPLSEQVFFPSWSRQASQDWPFEDGVCGTLDISIEALTPVFVRGAGGDETKPFATPDGGWAIPGTAIRGMLRNVLEIATFGKFRPVNDHRFGVRDLQNEALYVRRMAKILREPGATGKRENVMLPLVYAGWLRAREDDPEHPAEITPCSFAKIEYRLLEEIHRRKNLRGRYEPGLKLSAPKKYAAWGPDRKVRVRVSEPIGVEDRGTSLGAFSMVLELDGPGAIEGTLVFTGQPAAWKPGEKRKKHHDFVFYDRHPTKRIPVSKRTFDDFRFIHSNRGQQNRRSDQPNEEWGFWKKELDRGGEVPVFFLADKETGELKSMGLAMMFRLAFEHSVGELASRNQRNRDLPELDFVETLFGFVPGQDLRKKVSGEQLPESLRGRVSFGLAVAKDAKLVREVKGVLGTPKASYYPNYVEQSRKLDEPGALPRVVNDKPLYFTYMDAEARLRGWKRYRPQDPWFDPKIPPKCKEEMKTTFTPLAEGTRFVGRIRLHNVKPEELGALLWALDFGGNPDAVHTLGMAKPWGFGRVKLQVTGADLRANRDGMPLGNELFQECVQRFETMMENWATGAGIKNGWKGSIQLRELFACARPLPAGSEEGRHMDLYHPRDGNQFALAKSRSCMFALPPASGGQVRAVATAEDRVRAEAEQIRPDGGGGRSGRGGPGGRGPGFGSGFGGRGPAPRGTGFGAGPVARGSAGRGRQAPQSRPGPNASAPAGPKAGEQVEAIILEEKTKKGLLIARLAVDPQGKDRKGCIQGSAEKAGEWKPGDKVVLTVASVRSDGVEFRIPPEPPPKPNKP